MGARARRTSATGSVVSERVAVGRSGRKATLTRVDKTGRRFKAAV